VRKGDTLEIQLELPGGMKSRTLAEIIAEKNLKEKWRPLSNLSKQKEPSKKLNSKQLLNI
jgi:hypothetical protein